MARPSNVIGSIAVSSACLANQLKILMASTMTPSIRRTNPMPITINFNATISKPGSAAIPHPCQQASIEPHKRTVEQLEKKRGKHLTGRQRKVGHQQQNWQLLLTSRSATRRRPFSHKARSPQVRTHTFTAQSPDLRHFVLITRASRSLARSSCSAAPSIRSLFIDSRFMLHASSPHSVALMQLRFTSFAVINLRRDFHPQACAHAGRT